MAATARPPHLSGVRLEAEDAVRGEQVRSAGARSSNREAGAAFGNGRTTSSADGGPYGGSRELGLRTIERMRSVLSADAGDMLTDVVERDRSGLDARYIDAVSNPAYERAFWKRLHRPETAQFEMTLEEGEAMRKVAAVESEGAMSVGTTSAGGFGVPFQLDRPSCSALTVR